MHTFAIGCTHKGKEFFYVCEKKIILSAVKKIVSSISLACHALMRYNLKKKVLYEWYLLLPVGTILAGGMMGSRAGLALVGSMILPGELGS